MDWAAVGRQAARSQMPSQMIWVASIGGAPSFRRWARQSGGGSGWVLLTYSPRDTRLLNQWASEHTTTLPGKRPILALDMFEHSYHIDYDAKSAVHVDAFMNVIRWDNPAKLYDRYSREAS